MGWINFEVIVKIFTGAMRLILLPIALLTAAGVTLVDGIAKGDWHKDLWTYTVPETLHNLWEPYTTSIYD